MSTVAGPGDPGLHAKDLSDPALLRAEAPLPMPEQDFAAPAVGNDRDAAAQGAWVPRAAIFAGCAR